jgi:nucleoside phosphorylase
MRVLVTFAMEAEFAPWRRRHAFRRKESVHGSHRGGSDAWYSSRIDDLQLDVYLTGIGWKGAKAFLSSLLKEKPDLCISSGLAGGLRPELKSGEIVVAREALLLNGGKRFRSRPLLVDLAEETGATPVKMFLTNAQVVCRAQSKKSMAEFGDVVEMESFHVLTRAREQQVPALAIRAISDTVEEDLPLDFAWSTGGDGQISYGKLLLQVGRRPHKIPAMINFGKRSEKAAQNLADFLDKYIAAVRKRYLNWGLGTEEEAAAQ